MSTNQKKCQNCDQFYDQDFKFCPHCGQKANDELTIGVLFYNTISNYFSFDARFLKSFLPLVFKPGHLAMEFIKGKRLLYLHPAQMYLFISVIFFFVISFSTRELVSQANKFNEQVVSAQSEEELIKENSKVVLDSVQLEKVFKPLKENQEKLGLKDEDFQIADSIIKNANNERNMVKSEWGFDKKRIDSMIASGSGKESIYKEMGMSDNAGFLERRLFANLLNLIEGSGAGGMVQAFFDSIPIAMFFLLPLFAFILKIFYFNKGTYAHHLVFSFYFFSFLFTVFAILFALNRFVFPIPDGIDWLVALSTYFYFLFALMKFYGQHWFLTWIKSGVITFIFTIFIIPTSFALLLAFSFLFY
ncbi:DUF3667 domain-containing protein [Winogradskyella alexanderae]|uniref:DUF3667 domain-containing protein n=1 Tax=Winogradskyella alexanderae TaxID=2877123 RepID=A0ABS7XTY5_9FLAO|nr:DUF3667 domain-containing protein [Winogradskyella alexanderae]MCA0133490.1 DUF3667 domain-containing protein [Winogradskyella alexanderae]